jgi:hypothetical protein
MKTHIETQLTQTICIDFFIDVYRCASFLLLLSAPFFFFNVYLKFFSFIMPGRSRAVYQGIAKWDPAAVWVYQTWIWRDYATAHDLAYLQGWLSGPPPGTFFLLDQTAERVPIWSKFGNFSFFGQPFVWLAMSNMGGNLGLVGSLADVNEGTVAAATGGAAAFVGIGIDPEVPLLLLKKAALLLQKIAVFCC